MTMTIRDMGTCAGHEIIGWNQGYSAAEVIRLVANAYPWYGKENPNKCPLDFGRAFYVISHARTEGNKIGYRSPQHAKRINRFAAYIEKHNLGVVTIAPDNPNPIHHRVTVLRPAIWTPHHDNLWKHIIQKKYYKKSPARDPFQEYR